MIHSLVKKPQAFRYSQIRDDLLPNLGYKIIWTYVDKKMEPRAACKYIVGLLHLAATQHCERELAQAVLERLEEDKIIPLSDLQTRFKKSSPLLPIVPIEQHTLLHYNQLIGQHQEVRHV